MLLNHPLYNSGQFWSVCDDRFTDEAARVVCRQLGMAGGRAVCCGAYGSPAASPAPPIALDEVTCAGNETSLLGQCGHSPWGVHDCQPGEEVGMQCSGFLGERARSCPSPLKATWNYGYKVDVFVILDQAYVASVSPDPLVNGQRRDLLLQRKGYVTSLSAPSEPAWASAMALHPTAGPPLLLYVQLASATHPGKLVALHLQRVEGDSVWTVARLSADAPEITGGQTGLLFRDVTTRATWGE
ncbi:hypothetical protein GPECTOR_37g181 [Gonium pectorale]|uniref:SRCR domain-containing protein n=1 Tax=Gonium pectorale TaxID=33097 RepID=A0A150GC86_GONPE|nr:hypothetical protein GPECTOR_37g181 [Gonium pectorale]|eukprot:KXZ47175.1 hypothetical protein GPECTOR_37g181 [Gonium pectorale]